MNTVTGVSPPPCLKELIITSPCASLVLRLAVMIPASPPEDGFSGKGKGYVLRRRLCESAPFASPLLSQFSCLLPASAVCSQQEETALLLAAFQHLSPDSSAPAGQRSRTATTVSLLTSLQPRPVDIVVAHLCRSHGCQGKLGLANPCHYSHRKQITR